jgi:tripartite-type tricarboxylate transporter receptor subunit TctC
MRSAGSALHTARGALLALSVLLPVGGNAAQGSTATADGYPARPIRIVVPFPPGAGTDIIARLIAQVLSEAWRQSVIVDNRTGAGGTIGSDIVAKANPDGYTLLLGNVSTLALAPTLHPKLPYVTLRDFAPITLVTTSHNVLVTHPSVPANSVKELIALAKAKPGFLTYGSSGSGTTSHLGGALFAHMAGVELVHVPYKGSAPGSCTSRSRPSSLPSTSFVAGD